MAEDRYAALRPSMERDMMNAFSFWYPKIKDCGIPSPKTVIFPVPPEIQRAFWMEDVKADFARIDSWIEDTVRPGIHEAGIGLVFLKNGGFSNKFMAGAACLPVMDSLAQAVIHIMQGAMECCGFQYDGTGELVARERIAHDARKTPCIYDGLPFRPEFRVFYDFDLKKPIFTADYWDRDYVYPNLHDMTDRLVYDGHYAHIREKFLENKCAVEKLVADCMQGVSGLSGPWSVDIMMDERDGKLWLIDMAVAEMSAYWEKRPGYEPPPEQPRQARSAGMADVLQAERIELED